STSRTFTDRLPSEGQIGDRLHQWLERRRECALVEHAQPANGAGTRQRAALIDGDGRDEGTLTLTGASTYTGDTNVNEGVLNRSRSCRGHLCPKSGPKASTCCSACRPWCRREAARRSPARAHRLRPAMWCHPQRCKHSMRSLVRSTAACRR